MRSGISAVDSRRYAIGRATAGVLCCLLWGNALAASGPDPIESFRARIEAARLLNVPPPPRGVREAKWQELSPDDWSAAKILESAGVERPPPDAPDALKMFYLKRLQRIRAQAPPVKMTSEEPIRLTGFPVMPINDAPMTRSIVLAPYQGACTTQQQPPANQMVLVSLTRPMPTNMGEEPVWIIGTLVPLASPSLCGTVAYVMVNARWTRYPRDVPVPPYRMPR